MFDLRKKVIIVTGAAGLLGSQFCEIILKYNGIPILLDINKEKLDKLKKLFKKKFNKKINTFVVDITKEEQIFENSILIKKKFKKIDALINNAAFNPKAEYKNELKNNLLENFELTKWNYELQVGLTGSFLCSKHYGKIISQNSKGGVIINISSDLGLIAPNQNLYSRSTKHKKNVKPVTYSVIKSGLIGLTRYLSTYWVDYNIRCNAICPGGIENEQSKTFIKKMNQLIPLSRMAKKNEYQSTLIWMLSDQSSYLNGAIISVDGGRTAW